MMGAIQPDFEGVNTMKRLALLLATLLLTLTAVSALANSWNLTGPLLDYVSRTHDYDDYTALVSVDKSKSGVNTVAAFMTSRKHTLLLVGHKDADGWQVFTCNNDVSNADSDAKPQLLCMDDQVVISNAMGNQYVFQWMDEESEMEPAFYLVHAEVNDMTIAMDQNNHYTASENGVSIRWYINEPIMMTNADLPMLPGDSKAVRTMNTVRYLSENYLCSFFSPVSLHLNDRLPVYSAPDVSSYRAANGKALVSLKDSYIPLAHAEDGWAMIEYAIDAFRYRIGWVKDERIATYNGSLGGEGIPVQLLPLTNLTDDPFHSHTPIASADQLTDVRLLCSDCSVPWYCYISAQWNGQTIWGFVPTAAVIPDAGVLSSMLVDGTALVHDPYLMQGMDNAVDIHSSSHHFAVETDTITFLEPVSKPLFELSELIFDDNGRTTGVKGSFGTIIEDDCYGPFGFGAMEHTYPLAADFEVMIPMDMDNLLNPTIPYIDIAEALIDWYSELDPDEAIACGMTTLIELNDAGEIAYMEYYYVPWG